MAKKSNQKLKLMVLRDILEQETDEEHALSLKQIIEMLDAQGIPAERKSLYEDLEALRQYGVDVLTVRDTTTRYYVGERHFELPELLLMADAVQSSRFITEKKTAILTEKLKALTSRHQGEHFSRDFHVVNRIKNMNESIYINVDRIHEGIAHGKQIEFLYYEYDAQKEQRLRHDGAAYRVSPFALHWDDENYYLIAYDPQVDQLRHYRVDRMKRITVTAADRQGLALYEAQDREKYNRRTFSMFTGEETTVVLEFDGALAGAVIDRFGKDTMFIPGAKGCFRIQVPVAVSPPFFGWLAAFGGRARILSPASVIDAYREQLQKCMP